MKNSMIYYSVGPLLYCPANNESIVKSLTSQKFGNSFSLALCLEDTINDDCVADAEKKLINSIKVLFLTSKNEAFFMPKIFIRVREPDQIVRLLHQLHDEKEIITGFIIPKFSSVNASAYISLIKEINKQSQHKFYMMPILESADIINLQNRYDILYDLKNKLKPIEQYVLNIRVGSNDLCHMFGFRRHSTESIHKIRPIANIFSDIITVFGLDYVISGPVWEYYNGSNWKNGLENELYDDKLSGFVGKTVIHPNQIPIINDAYKVSSTDLADANAIIHWDKTSNSFVSGNSKHERMNEYKTHFHWAKKIIFLSEAFGVKND